MDNQQDDGFFNSLMQLLQVEEATNLARNNRSKIDDNTPCGCYYCLETFNGSDIEEWVDKDITALCPRCNIDSVIPNVINSEALVAAHERWFSGIE